jgi:LuxR family maltose regulon positive regulatory protein
MNDQATDSLKEALTLGEPEGYVRTFVDEGKPMKELLRLAASQNFAKDYIADILAVFEPASTNKQLIAALSLIEPLSDRELEVLRLLNSELSGPEIAKELMVSENTMRTHTKNIYSKLNIHSRRAAVRRAEEINLF